jgi:hypothetical protein
MVRTVAGRTLALEITRPRRTPVFATLGTALGRSSGNTIAIGITRATAPATPATSTPTSTALAIAFARAEARFISTTRGCGYICDPSRAGLASRCRGRRRDICHRCRRIFDTRRARLTASLAAPLLAITSPFASALAPFTAVAASVASLTSSLAAGVAPTITTTFASLAVAIALPA